MTKRDYRSEDILKVATGEITFEEAMDQMRFEHPDAHEDELEEYVYAYLPDQWVYKVRGLEGGEEFGSWKAYDPQTVSPHTEYLRPLMWSVYLVGGTSRSKDPQNPMHYGDRGLFLLVNDDGSFEVRESERKPYRRGRRTMKTSQFQSRDIRAGEGRRGRLSPIELVKQAVRWADGKSTSVPIRETSPREGWFWGGTRMDDDTDPWFREQVEMAALGRTGAYENPKSLSKAEMAKRLERAKKKHGGIEGLGKEFRKRRTAALRKKPVRDLITKSRKLWDKYVARPTKTNLRAFIKHVDVMEAQHKVHPSKMLAKEMAKFRTALGAEMVEHGLTATSGRKPRRRNPRGLADGSMMVTKQYVTFDFEEPSTFHFKVKGPMGHGEPMSLDYALAGLALEHRRDEIAKGLQEDGIFLFAEGYPRWALVREGSGATSITVDARQLNPDIPPSQVLEAELKDIRRKKKQDRTRKLEQALIESRLPESSRRRRNPEESHWAIRIPSGRGRAGTPGRYAQVEGIEYERIGPNTIRILSYGRFDEGKEPETSQRYRVKQDDLGIVEGVTFWQHGERAPRGKKGLLDVANERYLTDYPKAEGSSMILPGKGRIANPEGWQKVDRAPAWGGAWYSAGPSTHGFNEFYQGHGTHAELDFYDVYDRDRADELLEEKAAWMAARVRDAKTGRWYDIEDDLEQSEAFYDRKAALKKAASVAKLIRDAKIVESPRYTREWIQWFARQKPNQVDYVRLFWDNDRNGAYDINLTSSVKESRELFEEIFEEYL